MFEILKIQKSKIQKGDKFQKSKISKIKIQTFQTFKNSKKHSVSPVHSINEIQKLKNIFADNIRQFNVYHNDEIVAGTTIFQTKNVIHIQYIGSDTNKNKLGSLDFLFYKLINELFTDYKFFDFGTSNEKKERKNKICRSNSMPNSVSKW